MSESTTVPLILRSSHILRVRIESSRPGEWNQTPEHGLSRSIEITLKLEESLLGTTRERPGDRVDVRVWQYRPSLLWNLPTPGVWSEQELAADTELLVFAHFQGDAVTEMLEEPTCQSVLPAAGALAGVRLALRAEAEALSVFDLLTEARRQAASLDDVFAEYLSSRLAAGALEQMETLEAAMQLLVSPDLADAPRNLLLASLRTVVTCEPTSADQHVHHLAIAMFRLLGVENAAPLHGNLSEVFLPDLLGLTGGAPEKTADEVFRDHPEERLKLQRLLESKQKGREAADPLLEWIRRSASEEFAR